MPDFKKCVDSGTGSCGKAKIKTYYLVHIYFGDYRKGEENSYTVYSYKKSRRFTVGQALKYIRHEPHEVRKTGELSNHATIEVYWDIINKLNINPKLCDRYCTFAFFHYL